MVQNFISVHTHWNLCQTWFQVIFVNVFCTLFYWFCNSNVHVRAGARNRDGDRNGKKKFLYLLFCANSLLHLLFKCSMHIRLKPISNQRKRKAKWTLDEYVGNVRKWFVCLKPYAIIWTNSNWSFVSSMFSARPEVISNSGFIWKWTHW